MASPTRIVVFIPGILGSKLWLDEEEIWPGSVRELIGPYRRMQDLLREELVAKDVIREFAISDQYDRILTDLSACGFEEKPSAGLPTLYVFPYDWRKDNFLAASLLAQRVDEIVKKHQQSASITLVAHSMGGLVSRAYLESGAFTSTVGFSSIEALFTLATPHLGSPMALLAALGQEKRLFLNRDQVAQLANDDRYPSLYQLLPHRTEKFVWDRTEHARVKPVDIYEPAIYEKLGLRKGNIDAALAFHSRMDLSRRPSHVRYFFFCGTRQVTTTAVYVSTPSKAPLRAVRFELEDAGDGTVPAWSAAAPGVQGLPVGGSHGTIYKDDGLRSMLFELFDRRRTLAAKPKPIEVAVRDTVVRPGDAVHVSLTFGQAIPSLRGSAAFELNEGGNFVQFGSANPIQYDGVTVEKLGIRLSAPAKAALFRVAIRDQNGTLLGSDDLFVQRDGARRF